MSCLCLKVVQMVYGNIDGYQRVQSQTCLSYAECSRKSLVCKMYPIVNKQVKFLTAFPSSQMHRAKLAFAMSWIGNVSSI